MKELTIEEKASAYDSIIEKANKMHSENCDACKACIEELIPELAESEDEKVRKEIITYFRCQSEEEPTRKEIHDKWIAWLEKQAERKTPQWMIDFLDSYRRKIGCSLDHDEARDVEGKILCIMQWLENQDEQEKDILEDAILDGNEDGLIAETIRFKNEKQAEERKITHEEICKSYGIPDIGEFSDGYHTFNGLYKQRMILFAVLVKTYKDRAWKSWKHEDGLDCFGGGWFIVGIDTPEGTYTYHYEAKDWDRFDCQILEKAKHWDGHDESDVERLFSLVSNANKDEVIKCLINGMKFYYEDNEEATWGTQKFSMKVKDILSWLEKQCELKPEENKENIGGISADWSEEDEAGLGDALWAIKQARTIAKNENDMGNLWYAENWLKSLRPQNKWKPSDEQMTALRFIKKAKILDPEERESLNSLYIIKGRVDMKAEAPEKIYIPITEGQEIAINEWGSIPLSQYEHKRVVENIEYTRTDAFIEKVEEFLYEKLNNGDMECGDIHKFIENFKKAMEGKV